MNGTEIYNVALQALHQASIAYSFAQEQLERANITLPPADQLLSHASALFSYIMAHSPTVVQKFYVLLDQLPIKETPILPIFLSLVLLYIVYCTIMASFRWLYRLVFGFIRFSLIVAIIGSCIYVLQQKMMNSAMAPGSSTETGDQSRTYNAL